MKWITHTGVAVALAAALHAPAGMLAGVAAGSVLPDAIDHMIAGRNQKLWSRIHRGVSHWWGWYLGLALFAFVAGTAAETAVLDFLRELAGGLPRTVTRFLQQGPVGDGLLGLALGAFSHVLLDALNPSGVPLFPFSSKPRIRYPIVSTGTWREYVFLAVALVLLGLSGEEILKNMSRWRW